MNRMYESQNYTKWSWSIFPGICQVVFRKCSVDNLALKLKFQGKIIKFLYPLNYMIYTYQVYRLQSRTKIRFLVLNEVEIENILRTILLQCSCTKRGFAVMWSAKIAFVKFSLFYESHLIKSRWGKMSQLIHERKWYLLFLWDMRFTKMNTL